jgi:hypothetical protein
MCPENFSEIFKLNGATNRLFPDVVLELSDIVNSRVKAHHNLPPFTFNLVH